MEDSNNNTGTRFTDRFGKGDLQYDRAVRDLVGQFAAIPQSWIHIVAEYFGDDFHGVMWGTMFVVSDSVDQWKIRKLLRSVEHDELGSFHEVPGTGVFAWEIDGELVLGIHGAGYDFYAEHWSKLYDALEYRWHVLD